MQPGEGDACRLSVQCTDHRQICVDDACIREERVRAEDLTLGDWRTLTPESTDENPLSTVEVGLAPRGPTLDEDGEVVIVGSGRDAAGRLVLFRVGQDVRVITGAEGAIGGRYALPYLDGFLLFDASSTLSFVGPAGDTQWAATMQGSRAPYDTPSVPGFIWPLIHTPSGPVAATILTSDGGSKYDIIALQQLDLELHRFNDIDLVDGPFLVGASIGVPVMGPTGLELMLGRADDLNSPQLSAYSVATGVERAIGDGPLPWDAEVTALTSDEWVVVLSRDRADPGCATVAYGSNGAELGRFPVAPAELCSDLPVPERPRSFEGHHAAAYLKNASRSGWFWFNPASASNDTAESVDGLSWEPVGIGSVVLGSAASRYGKTWELLSENEGIGGGGGVYFAERALVSIGRTP